MTKLFYDVIEQRLSIQERQQLRTWARVIFEQFISAIRYELQLPRVEASFFSCTTEPVDPPAPTSWLSAAIASGQLPEAPLTGIEPAT
ncbi:hypothetical protein [Nocardia sp. NPDC059229]|uniref:hypothetical protein n=1 Tax=Nocardia sp. NPDC059229 TaxID=3346778 RepID=UPI0036BF5B6D